MMHEIGLGHPLFAAVLKLERAKQHLDELDERIEAHRAAHPPRINSVYDAEVGAMRVYFEPPARPPFDLGPIVGDVVQNVRAALDYAVCALALQVDPQTPCQRYPQTFFPITQNEAAWNEERVQRMLERLPDGAREVMHRLQPFQAGSTERMQQHALWLLQVLSNRDKHRELVPTATFSQLRAPTIVLEEDGTPVPLIPASQYDEASVLAEIAPRIGFRAGDDEEAEVADVAQLREMYDIVRDRIVPLILDFFARDSDGAPEPSVPCP